MSDLKQILTELKAKVEATRKQLEDEEAAIRVIEAMLKTEPVITRPVFSPTKVEVPVSLPSVQKKQSLIENIRDILPSLIGQEFTIASLDAILAEQGKQPKTRTQISMAFAKLAAGGEIIKVADGTGNTPHVFKVGQLLSR